MRRSLRMTTALLLAAMLAHAGSALAQPAAPGSASEFYMQYRRAFQGATTIEDLLPYMSVAARKQVESTPAGERADMFGMVKMLGAITNVKIVRETRTAAGATLTVEAIDAAHARTTGTIEVVREGTAWKLGRESWKAQ